MDPATLNQVLGIIGQIVGILGSIAGGIAAYFGIRNRFASKKAQGSVDGMKARIDNLLTALLRQESQEIRLRRIEAYLAEHEATKRIDHVEGVLP